MKGWKQITIIVTLSICYLLFVSFVRIPETVFSTSYSSQGDDLALGDMAQVTVTRSLAGWLAARGINIWALHFAFFGTLLLSWAFLYKNKKEEMKNDLI